YAPMAAWLAQRHPDAAAAFIGACAGSTLPTAPLSYLALGQHYHPHELKAGLAYEAKRRVPVFATLVATGATLDGMAVYGMWREIDFRPQHLPIDIVQQEI